MLRLGEQTGAIDQTLDRIATLYSHEAGDAIARLQAAIEPALTVLMGGLLLWIASAVLDPIHALITRLPL
jgi:type IV pilus assembly protein PilC